MPDPDNQIVVGAIVAPAAPYGVIWAPSYVVSTEVWPQVEHSCGTGTLAYLNPAATQLTTDGSFGDPAVRITQFANAFARNVVGSICDASFAPTMTAIAQKIGQLIGPACVAGAVQNDA